MQAAVEALVADLEGFQGALHTLVDSLGDEAFFVPTALAQGAEANLLTMALDNYASPDGEAARLVVMLEDEPYSEQALATVNRLRDKVSHHSMGSVQGISASFRDIYDVTGQDMVRIAVLVLGGISVVLVLLMRSIVAPIYMLLTILLSYATTMGLARLVFEDILDERILFSIPLLLFVFLVALGMDYNIFLMGRVKEEVAKHGTRRGIREALENTGGIISSAGIIMAGTFAAMMTSSLMALVQLGFAVAVGVLLDTFVIRTTLLPAIAVLLDRWNWWPGRAPAAPMALEPTAAD
jgi:RND superfamily putative drug exporter